jgi:hypothetical protein
LAKIFVGDAFVKVCTLHDILNRGACLQVSQAQELPELFDLVLDLPTIKTACRVVWCNKDRIGVEFIPDNGARRDAGAPCCE